MVTLRGGSWNYVFLNNFVKSDINMLNFWECICYMCGNFNIRMDKNLEKGCGKNVLSKMVKMWQEI